jgi:predicted transcriptional regulator
MAMGTIQPVTELSMRNLPGGKGRPAHKAYNLTAICKAIIEKMLEPHRLESLWATIACFRDNFTFFNAYLIKHRVYFMFF